MAITGIPTFTDGEIPPAAKLNQLGDAITNKFGGAVVPGDMTWPFVVEGNIDFDQSYGIVGLRTFWNIVNAAEYDSLDDAMTAAEDAGGTCVLIPPDTTITADNVDIDTSGITIMGCGKTSVIALTVAASNYLLSTAAALSDISIENLTLDGQSTGTGSPLGVIVKQTTRFTMRDVHVKNFKGAGVQLTNDGTDGNACVDAKILDCTFTGGAGDHVLVTEADGLQIANMKSDTCAGMPITMEPGASSGLLKRILLDDIEIESPTGVGVSILGASGTANDNWSLIDLRNIQVNGAADDAFNLGLAAKILKYTTMVGCSAPGALGDGAKINLSEGDVQNNFFRDATGDGIDMLATENTVVAGNNVTGAGATAIVPGTGGGNYIGQNPGHFAAINSGIHADATTYTRTGSSGDLGWSYTIPADTLRIGDVLRVTTFYDYTHSAGSFALALLAGATSLAVLPSTSTSTAGEFNSYFIVTALTGAGTAGTKTLLDATGDTIAITAGASSTVDWTTDQALTLNATSLGAGSKIDIDRITVQILGGV